MAHHGPELARQNRRQERLPLLLGDGLLAVTFLIKRLLFGNRLVPKLLHTLLNIAKAYLCGIEFHPGRLQRKIDVGLINTWHLAYHFLDFRSTGGAVHANQSQVHGFLCRSVTQLFNFSSICWTETTFGSNVTDAFPAQNSHSLPGRPPFYLDPSQSDSHRRHMSYLLTARRFLLFHRSCSHLPSPLFILVPFD